MPRAGLVGNPQPYQVFGNFAGLPCWAGSLSLLAAAPGVGKTSWLLRMVSDAARVGLPAAIGCYEHTAAELKYRMRLQAQAALAGPHAEPEDFAIETELAKVSQAVLLSLSDREDTMRVIEEILLEDYGFPEFGPAVLAVDYLQRVPVVGLTGPVPESQRSGEAAAAFRALARRRGWAVIAAGAMRAEHFADGNHLFALLGDERVPYEADRILLMRRRGQAQDCGCVELEIHTLKDRTGPEWSFRFEFWGERFFPAIDVEKAKCNLYQKDRDAAGKGSQP